MDFNRYRPRALWLAIFCIMLFADGFAYAWTPGAHASDWKPGQEIDIAFEFPPGADAAERFEYLLSLQSAVNTWNNAQAPFGGLKLVVVIKSAISYPDVIVRWKPHIPKAPGGTSEPLGTTSSDPRTNGPIHVDINIGSGLSNDGLTSVLVHELGHVEGLGHSAASELMKASHKKSDFDFGIDPTADDLLGKKSMWGTEIKTSSSELHGEFTPSGPSWDYKFTLHAVEGFTDPVTEWTIDLLAGTRLADFHDFILPDGWLFSYLSGEVKPGEDYIDSDPSSPALLRFYAASASAGIMPSQTGVFGFSSLLQPGETRAFTGAVSYDSDQFRISAPSVVPEPANIILMLAGVSVVGAALQRRSVLATV
jgi:hypothetical protein